MTVDHPFFLGDLQQIKINIKGRLAQFLLTFPDQSRPFEFHTTASGAMAIMGALQTLQVRYKLSIPQAARRRGKPTLRVVTPDE